MDNSLGLENHGARSSFSPVTLLETWIKNDQQEGEVNMNQLTSLAAASQFCERHTGKLTTEINKLDFPTAASYLLAVSRQPVPGTEKPHAKMASTFRFLLKSHPQITAQTSSDQREQIQAFYNYTLNDPTRINFFIESACRLISQFDSTARYQMILNLAAHVADIKDSVFVQMIQGKNVMTEFFTQQDAALSLIHSAGGRLEKINQELSRLSSTVAFDDIAENTPSQVETFSNLGESLEKQSVILGSFFDKIAQGHYGTLSPQLLREYLTILSKQKVSLHQEWKEVLEKNIQAVEQSTEGQTDIQTMQQLLDAIPTRTVLM